jgi:hypothetical protein
MKLFWIFLLLSGSFYGNCKIFDGSQKGCSGEVSVARVACLCQELNERKAEGIYFNPEHIRSVLVGGTCSAMSLAFARLYLSGCIDPELFVESSEQMRELQAAYNTIEVFPKLSGDIRLKKVESLLAYFYLKVIWASPIMDIRHSRGKDLLAKLLPSFQEGVYLIRVLKPSDNRRLEECGHSIIYIQTKEETFLYDPNNGFLQFQSPEKELTPIFEENYREYGVYEVRFYQIEPC